GIRQVAAGVEERIQGSGHAQAVLDALGIVRERPLPRGSQVRVFQVQTLHHGRAVRPRYAASPARLAVALLSQAHVPPEVARAKGRLLASRAQALLGELTDRLQRAIPAHALPTVLDQDERLLRQPAQWFEDGVAGWRADRLGIVEAPSAGEHGQAAQ